jgi:hypothetical protein
MPCEGRPLAPLGIEGEGGVGGDGSALHLARTGESIRGLREDRGGPPPFSSGELALARMPQQQTDGLGGLAPPKSGVGIVDDANAVDRPGIAGDNQHGAEHRPHATTLCCCRLVSPPALM